MLVELTVTVDDRPGVLAEVGELLGEAKVNIETLCVSTHRGQAVLRLVVDDDEGAAQLLVAEGYQVSSRTVFQTTLDDRPGELGRYCRRLADSGVNISAAYVSRRSNGETEVILAVEE